LHLGVTALMRVLTYNVRSLRDSARDVAEVMRASGPDVVCVQEAPRFLFGRRKIARLATDAGLEVVTGGRAAGAMLLLARPGLAVLERRNLKLTKTPRLHQRGLAVAVFEVGGRNVAVASMHLGLRADERLRHVPEVLAAVRALGAPAVLAGDVNEDPGDPAWSILTQAFQDACAVAGAGAPTAPAVQPRRRIDAVFVDPSITVLSCRVLDGAEVERASDHRPVLVELAL
jgi:endonuclease/exonuclease/phosphatase family metal-dependent hydrolase